MIGCCRLASFRRGEKTSLQCREDARAAFHNHINVNGETRGPYFVIEPSNHVEFSNETGVSINCTAHGIPEPLVTWVRTDGSLVSTVPSLRRVMADGSLVFPPFNADEYRAEVHTATYKCMASNKLGTVVSRDVNVKAGISQHYEIQVHDVHVIKGNTAVFKCIIPKAMEGFVTVVSWIRNSFLEIQPKSLLDEDKYLILLNGDLHIQSTGPEDDGAVFQCKTRNRLTGSIKTSMTAARLTVIDSLGSMSPKIMDTKDVVRVKQGETAVLPCVTQGIPVPVTTWFGKVHHEQVLPLHVGARLQQTSGALIISDTRLADSSAYICVANNTGGTDRAETALTVTVPLSVKVQPPHTVADVGSSVTFTCEVTGIATSFSWLKNGRPIRVDRVRPVTADTVRIDSVQPEDRGMYQCMARNGLESAQGAAELRLGDSKPDFRETFAEKIEYPGGFVSLPCVATGSPPPHFKWTLDGIVVAEDERVSTSEMSDENGNVVTSLNITDLVVEDGGLYSCHAINRIGSTEHGARLHIYGTPVVRSHLKLSAVAGERSIINCPSYGYPIEKYSWEKDGVSLPDNIRQTVYVNGTLVISEVRKVYDSGRYTCIIRNNDHIARGDVEIVVLVPPKIAPFSFQEELLREGMRARLQCVVSEGDLPLSIKWVKDGGDVPPTLGVLIRDLDEFSSILTINSVTPRHNGNYTCVVANHVATIHSTAELYVNVPPKIIPFNFIDDQFYMGMRAHITCAVSQGDLPIAFQWLKDGSEISPTLGVATRYYDQHANSLSIESVTSKHSGNYTCIAHNVAGTAMHSAQLLVHVAPKIIPFSFQDDHLFEGVLAQISCVVYQGDLPLEIDWLKDGIPVAADTGLTLRQIDDYSSVLTIGSVQRKHSGNYTCVASNSAASSNFSASLTVNVPPKIVPFSFQDDHLFEGMLVRVSCVVSRGDLPLTIRWTKDGALIPPSLGVTLRDFDEYSSVLSIESVAIVHNGNYTCYANNSAGKASHTAQLLVNVPPRWRIQPKDSSVLLGREVLLNCQADGFPKPKIKWMKAEGGNIIQHRDVIHMSNVHVLSNGSLHIKHSTETHRGQYFCIANNGVGGDLSKAVTVNVNVPVTFHSKYQAQSAILGENTSLVCSAKGETPITLNWTVDQSRSSRHIINETPTRFGRISTLQIMAVEREDSGSYLCAAKNEFGADETTIELTVKESPEPPTNLEVSLRKNQKAFLSWTAPYNGNSPIIRYVVQYKFTSASWNSDVLDATFDAKEASGTIGGLRPATTYNFRVLAENDIGVSQASEVVTVTTEEEAPGGPPQAVNVEALDSQTLKVTWKPPREDLLYGVLRGYQVGHRARGSNDPYAFQILEIPANATPPAELSLNVTELRKYSPYHIVVAAYNNKGRGPLSQEVMVMTAEDIPSKPPQGVRCSTLTSQTIYITWQPPPPNAMNGVLLGYKVFYQPAEDWFDGKPSVKTTSAYKMTVVKLEKFTNYSIQVLAFTKVGDGVKSLPLYCKTHEDVPGSPANIRVLPASGESVLVVWRPPLQTNGIVTRYIVYCKNLDGRDVRVEKLVNEPVIRHSVSANVLQHEVRRLRRNRRYEFWVTAATGAGEGQSSRVITQSPASNKVPAAVASFDDVVVTNWKENLLLECHTIGAPFPDRRWLIDGHTIVETSRIRIVANGSLSVLDVQGEDEGNYTCRVENDHGHGEVKYQLIIQAPPSLSSFEVLSITMTSITVHWRVKSSGGHPIQGFILNHKRDQETTWERTEISPSQETYTLESLACGTKYHLYLVAVSRVGIGNPAETLTITTEGTIPTIPPKQKLIEENSSFVTLRLDSWIGNGDCPITALSVEYRVKTHYKWAFVTESANLEQKKLVIPGLLPATWYKLRMTANSSAGASTANYDFATLTPSGGTVPPELGLDEDIKGILFYLDLRFIIAIAASLFVILAALITMCICIKKGKASSGKRKEKQINTLHKEETMQSRPNSWTKPPRQDGNADTFSRIHTGNQHIGRYADSPDELAPCATFDLPTQQYRQQMKTFGHGSSIPLGVPGGLIPNTANSTLNLQTFVAPSRPVSDISGKFDTLPNPNNYHHTYTRYSNPAETLSVGYRSPVATSTPSSPRRIHMIDVPTPNGPGMITCNTPPVSKDYEPVIRENGSIPRDGAPPMVPVNKDHLQRTALADEGITRFSGPRSQWKKVIFEDPNHHDETAETTFIFENPLDENEHITTGHGTLSGRDKKPQVQRINKLDDKVNSIGESTRLLAK
uniref:Down syndrome cell adhesion molecule-like protein Dscam2 n=1 Tax=Strigamia maritima TaxID=126957 RepID=T1JA71_STRMM